MRVNPIRLLFRKMLRHPYLQSQGNRGILALILIFGFIVVSIAIGTVRDLADVANCEEKGGTPIYREKIQEFVYDGSGQGAPEQVRLKVYDHCDLIKK